MHFFHAFQIPHFEVRSDQSVWVLRRERELWLVAEYMSFVLFQIITLCLMQSCYAELWAVQAEVYQESCNQKYFRFPPRNSGSCRVERGQSAWKQGTGAGTLNPAPARKHGHYFQDHCPLNTSAIAAKMRKVNTFLIFHFIFGQLR